MELYGRKCHFGNSRDNVCLAYVSDILQDEKNRTIGLFEHQGIQGHPGDRGMKLIAERFLEELEEII